MRDYLFRGKSLFDGSWVEGYLFSYGEPNAKETYILGELDHRESIYDVWKCAIEVDPLTVGQYTGVRDKTGERIFEGDIVSYLWDKATVCMLTCFKDGEFCMKPISANQPGEYWEIRMRGEDVKIIDNIHGIREIMKGE